MGPVLVLLLVASINAGYIDKALLADLQRHFHSSSIVIYYGSTAGLEDIRQLLNLVKMSKVPVGVFQQHNSKEATHKPTNSLYVILSPLDLGINILSEMFQRDCNMGTTWLLYFSSLSYQYLLADVYIPLDCEVIVFQPDYYTLSEVYNIQNRLEMSLVGTWHETMGLAWTAKDLFQRRSDLKGITIKASTINCSVCVLQPCKRVRYVGKMNPINDLVCNLLQTPFSRWSAQDEKDVLITGRPKPILSISSRKQKIRALKYPLDTLKLRGMCGTSGCVQNPPITIVQEQNGTVTGVGGYFGEVWKILEKEMNFTTEYYLPFDGSFGAKGENGSWNGMIDMILKAEIELAVSEFTITPIRTEVVDFTMPFIFTRFCVLIQQPGGIRSSWTNFLAPFSTNLWLTILLVILIMSLHFAASHQDFIFYPGLRFIEAFFQIFGIFCQQGQEETPKTLSGQILCMTTYLTAVILPAAYSAALTSFLTVQHTELPFTTLRGLLETSSYQLGVLANSGQLNYFDHSEEPLMQKLNEELIHPHREDLPTSVSEGLLRICKNPEYAFMASLDIAMGLVKDVPCSVIPVTGASIPETLAMAISKDSPYTQLINYNIEKMQKSGILARLRINAWPTRMPKSKPLWTEVGLDTMAPVLCIVIVGILAAICCLSIEHIINMKHIFSQFFFIKR